MRTKLAPLVLCAGCSLFVKFDDKDIPIDAPPDGFMPFSADVCNFKEPNDTPATAQALAATDTGPAAICPNHDGTVTDLDYYTISVPDNTASVTVAIDFQVVSKGDLDLILFSADGSTMLAESRGVGSGESITCPGIAPACAPLATGDYIAEVLPGVAGDFNQYTLALTITAGSGSGSGSGSAAPP